MTGTPLPLIGSACGEVLNETLPAVLDHRLSQTKMVLFCKMYRRIGIADLFMSGQPKGLFAFLSMSARAFVFFLEGADDQDKATGKSEPFFDALVCGDQEAQKDLAELSSRNSNPDLEYEDDFLYMRFLMDHFVLNKPEAECVALLDRYEVVIKGAAETRFDLCRAFFEKDQSLFNTAISELIDDRRAEIDEGMQHEKIPLDDVNTTAKLWVELLALLQLAQKAGLKTDENYPLAPEVARKIQPADLPPPDAWRDM